MGICTEWSRFHRWHRWLLLTALMVLLAGRTYAADELPKESVLPVSLATKAVQAAVDFCKKDGYRVSASVVDRAGVLRAMMRFDGAGTAYDREQSEEGIYRGYLEASHERSGRHDREKSGAPGTSGHGPECSDARWRTSDRNER